MPKHWFWHNVVWACGLLPAAALFLGLERSTVHPAVAGISVALLLVAGVHGAAELMRRFGPPEASR
jgi:hypothetical protein